MLTGLFSRHLCGQFCLQKKPLKGGRTGLVVMGGDLCSKGREFESQHGILDGNFFTFICCNNGNVCLKRQK